MHQCRSSFSTPVRRAFDVTPQVLPLVLGQFFVPLSSRRIVVGAGIRDRVVDKVVRQIWVVRMTVEGKLEDSSPRQLKLITQCLHVRRDNTQIFDDKLKVAQLLVYRLETASTQPLHRL